MQIGIDIRVLGNTVRSGIEEYTENLLEHLLPLDPRIKYKLFFSSFRGNLNSYKWLSLQNVEVHNYRFSNKLLFFSSGAANRPLIDQLMGGVDVFFSPHFFLTSLSGSCRRVTTFHDLSYFHFPEFFSWRKRIWHNFEMRPRWQSRFSDRIITVSSSTKNDLINIYNIDPAKIDVVYSGISPGIKIMSVAERDSFRRSNNLPPKFILFLGKLEPRKNIPSLIRAFDLLREDPELNDLHLVIIGSRGWLDRDIFASAVKSSSKDRIIFRNYIADELRSGYYNCASAFVYPSFFEGFGFPPLEAMSCGVPVIVSSGSSLSEVVGDGGLLIDPVNVNDIYMTLSNILKDRDFTGKILNKGIKQASKFNWNKTAEETLNCLTK